MEAPNLIPFVVGLVLCLMGWVALWLGTRLIGAVMGLGLGFVFGLGFSLAMGLAPGAASLVQLGCAAMGAVGGVFFIRALNSFIIALVGFLFGILLARLGLQLYCSMSGVPYALTPTNALLLVGIGVVMAGAAVWLRRGLAILVTAFVGTSFVTASLVFLHDMLPWSFVLVLLSSLFFQSFLSRLMSGKKSAASNRRGE